MILSSILPIICACIVIEFVHPAPTYCAVTVFDIITTLERQIKEIDATFNVIKV